MRKAAKTRMNTALYRLFRMEGVEGMNEQGVTLRLANDQSAILRRAMDALNSVCIKPPEKETTLPESRLPTPANTLPACPDLVTAQRITEPDGIPPNDPAEWREPFVLWLDSTCVRSPRCFGGVGCLHIAFCQWESGRGGVPCTRDVFERLLTERGFLIGEVSGVVLVSGLILREDFEEVGL
jgi:hypothetical protein